MAKRDLWELGWKGLVAELGVANATRFVTELHQGKEDYSNLRGRIRFTRGSEVTSGVAGNV